MKNKHSVPEDQTSGILVVVQPPTTQKPPLQHFVLGILCLVSQKGFPRTPCNWFYELMAQVVKAFPQEFPGLAVPKTAFSWYSKQLDSALQPLICGPVHIVLGSEQQHEVTEESAKHGLAWLQEWYGQAFIARLEPMADCFVEHLRKSEVHT